MAICFRAEKIACADFFASSQQSYSEMEIIMNKNRIIAGIAICTVATQSIVSAGITAYAEDWNTKNIVNKSTIDNNSTSESEKSNNEKEEVVYIMTDARGGINSVNVVNIFGKGSITDYGNYSAVKMLTSTQPINKTNDKIIFSTDDDRVYYQGTLDNVQIPWNINITYKLDGKIISPDELAGKSGTVDIHISITENENCESNFFNNYALQAAFTLDTNNCKNIKADGATLANVGSDKQISYTILPGKGLEADITADVNDFEMDAASINGVKLDLNIDIDNQELMDKVTDIINATNDLNNGAKDVADGASAIKDGADSVNTGANSIYTGANTLDDGINSLNNGINTISEALKKLDSRSSDLTGGSSQILDSLRLINQSLSGVAVTTDQLTTLTESSSAIKTGIDNLYNALTSLQSNMSYDNYKMAMQQNGLDVDELLAQNNNAVSMLTQQRAQLEAQIAQIDGVPGYEEMTADLSRQVGIFDNVILLLQGNSGAIGGVSAYLNTLSAGTDEIVAGAAQLKTSYEEFNNAIIQLANTLSDLAVNMTTLKNGIQQLTDNYEILDTGVDEYTDAVAQIMAGYTQLMQGTQALSDGSNELAAGSDTLRNGTSDLYAGAATLSDGTVTLHDGTNEFYENTKDMDTQVQDTIDDMLDSISGSGSDVVSFVSDKNENVRDVQFVIKTAAIKKLEQEAVQEDEVVKMNFWQKLLNLFGLN